MAKIKDGKRLVQNWRKRTKAKMVEAFGSICCLCKQKYEIELFDFHHLNPKDKEFNISSTYSSCTSWEMAVKELCKCVMLCSNCHRLVEYGYATVPEDAFKFDDTKIITTIDREVFPKYSKNSCPICGNSVLYRHTYCSHKCHKISKRKVQNRPSQEELKQLVIEHGLEGTGRIFGVTGNSIKKWLK